MTTTIEQLLERWDTGEGRPYKGVLIDWKSYKDDPDNIGCMCAQGQALHLIGGMSPEELHNLEQREADTRTMEVMGISRGQAILLRNINDSVDGAPSIVITNPEKVLGEHAQAVLALFKYIDSLDRDGWQKVDAARAAARDAAVAAAGDAARDAAGAAARDAARDAAGDAAWDAAGAAARDAARDAAGDAARDAAVAAAGAAAWAANEIQGHKILEKAGKPLFFLSMFGFKTVEALLEWTQ